MTRSVVRPVIHSDVSCRVFPSPTGGGCQIVSSVVGPVHPVQMRVGGGPDALVLVRDSAGMAGGDSSRTRLVVEAGAAVVLSDAGPTSLLASRDLSASQQVIDVDVGADGTALVLPHAAVPFAGSRSSSATRVELHPSATLVIGSLLTPGRVARGETWELELLEQTLSLRVGGSLLASEALRVMSGATDRSVGHLVTLVAYGAGMGTAVLRLRPVLGPTCGVAAPSDDLVVLRGIVGSAEEGYAVLRNAASAMLPELVGWPWATIGYAP